MIGAFRCPRDIKKNKHFADRIPQLDKENFIEDTK